MFREDLYYTNDSFELYTLTKEGKEDRFETFSEKFNRMYKGLRLNPTNMQIEPGPQSEVINLDQLVELFKSKDEVAWEKSKWIFDGKLRYLDGSRNRGNKIALSSFPRSGNTFMRKYTDLLTGVHTGSDCTLHVNVML
jgi:hypothetical protein